jgi:hypothetical protein
MTIRCSVSRISNKVLSITSQEFRPAVDQWDHAALVVQLNSEDLTKDSFPQVAFGCIGSGRGGMKTKAWIAVAALAVLLFPARAPAGSCDLVLRWDQQAIDSCIREMKSEIFILGVQVQTEESLNRLMRNNLCLLATDIKTENAASIAEIACEELKARAAEKKKWIKIQKAVAQRAVSGPVQCASTRRLPNRSRRASMSAIARSQPPAENDLRRDARQWRARCPGLLLGLSLQSLDRHER